MCSGLQIAGRKRSKAEEAAQMDKKLNKQMVNIGLLFRAIAIFSGLTIQGEFHMGNHGHRCRNPHGFYGMGYEVIDFTKYPLLFFPC